MDSSGLRCMRVVSSIPSSLLFSQRDSLPYLAYARAQENWKSEIDIGCKLENLFAPEEGSW